MTKQHSFIRRQQLWASGFALAAAVMAPMALAQGAAGGAAPLDPADGKFVEQAAQGSFAEVAMGQMARERGRHAQVKAFGERMVQDHSKAIDDLNRVARAKNVKLPATPGPVHQHHADALGKLSGAEFDRVYMNHMVGDHQKDVSEFEKAAKSAKDPEVKTFAARTLPTLQSHLKLARTTYEAVK